MTSNGTWTWISVHIHRLQCVLTGESSHTASMSSAAHMHIMHDSDNWKIPTWFSAKIDLKIIFGYCHIESVSAFHCRFSIYNAKYPTDIKIIIIWRAVFLWCASPMLYSHASSAIIGYEPNWQDKILFIYPSSALISAIAPPSTDVPILLFERSRLSWLWVPAKTERELINTVQPLI